LGVVAPSDVGGIVWLGCCAALPGRRRRRGFVFLAQLTSLLHLGDNLVGNGDLAGSSKPMTGSCAVRIEPHSACPAATSAPSLPSTQAGAAWRFVSTGTPIRGICLFWYLEDGHVDCGYALTGHKTQGVTTGCTFMVIDGGNDGEWVYVALSRGRQANTLYLANLEPGDEPCTHLTHPERGDAIDPLVASLGRRAAQIAAIDHAIGPPRRAVTSPNGPLGSSPDAAPNTRNSNTQHQGSDSPLAGEDHTTRLTDPSGIAGYGRAFWQGVRCRVRVRRWISGQ
jgi:hypothetical protein